MTGLSYEVGAAVESEEDWGELNRWLPGMLRRLLEPPAYNRASRPPLDQRGIYLFSLEGRHLYVGRTGITARTRQAATEPGTSFRARFDQHTRNGSRPWDAPFAMSLAKGAAVEQGVEIPSGQWWNQRAEHPEFLALFTDAKRRIGDEMEMRICAFDDDERGVRSLVAEVYAHVILQTPYNDFSPS